MISLKTLFPIRKGLAWVSIMILTSLPWVIVHAQSSSGDGCGKLGKGREELLPRDFQIFMVEQREICQSSRTCSLKTEEDRLKYFSHKEDFIKGNSIRKSVVDTIEKLCRDKMNRAYIRDEMRHLVNNDNYGAYVGKIGDAVQGVVLYHFPEFFEEDFANTPLVMYVDILCTGEEGHGYGKQLLTRATSKLSKEMKRLKRRTGIIELNSLKDAKGFYLGQGLQPFTDKHFRKLVFSLDDKMVTVKMKEQVASDFLPTKVKKRSYTKIPGRDPGVLLRVKKIPLEYLRQLEDSQLVELP